jgi:hypothetical protein
MKKHINDFSADNFYCCERDTNSAIMGDTGPTTCTAGTQINSHQKLQLRPAQRRVQRPVQEAHLQAVEVLASL